MIKKHRDIIFGTILSIMAVMILLGGCMRNLGMGVDGEVVEYVICKDSSLPEQLQDMLEDKKKVAGTFVYKNSMYMYLVVCYGKKSYSGYSVKVEECSCTEDTLYLQTQLLGPDSGEKVVETETFPYIVLRCERMDVFCVIES